MAKSKPQYLTTLYTSECELEKREVTLAKDSWEIFDELSKECVSVAHRNPEDFITWVLEHYLYLCKHSEKFDKGVLPDGISIKEEKVESSNKITMAYKGGARSEGDEIPYIKDVGFQKSD